MTPIHLNLPSEVEVIGEIFESYKNNAWRLSQDILQISLKNGIIIDVGFYPEHNLNGNFMITVFKEFFENKLEPEIMVKNPIELAKIIEKLANKYI